MKVLLFGGTTEGRELATWLAARPGVDVVAYAATEYGGSLLEEGEHLESRVERLSAERMRALMEQEDFACVVDATHPYADVVTANIGRAARDAGLPTLRIVRDAEPDGPWTRAHSSQDAARKLTERPGKILLTTGSKDLATYTAALPDFSERLYVRILPIEESLSHARELGLPVSHIIAMQGPFSAELNCALIRQLDIAVLVTKASGSTGGFWEKVEAAQTCGCELMVVHRPQRESGFTVQQAQAELVERYGA